MTIQTDPTALIITFAGFEKLWALRSKVIVPRSTITAIQFEPEFTSPGTLWRLLGTGIPAVLYAGYFFGDGKRDFLYLRNPRGWYKVRAKNVLAIETTGMSLDRIYLSMEPADAEMVLIWWKGKTA